MLILALRTVGQIFYTILMILFVLSVLPFTMFSAEATLRLSLMLADRRAALTDLNDEMEAFKRRQLR